MVSTGVVARPAYLVPPRNMGRHGRDCDKRVALGVTAVRNYLGLSRSLCPHTVPDHNLGLGIQTPELDPGFCAQSKGSYGKCQPNPQREARREGNQKGKGVALGSPAW